jgi:TPR repeat protein
LEAEEMHFSLAMKHRCRLGLFSGLAILALLPCTSTYARQQPAAPSLVSDNSWRQLAEEGYAFAQVNLGMSYAVGQAGVAKDYGEAVRWFRKAAAQNNPLGQLYLGNMYLGGLGVAKSPVEALRWYRMAATQGNAAAEFYVGNMYGKGEGVPKDESEAARWHLKAAEQGHEAAMIALGISYGLGRGVPQDHAEAYRWLRRCAERGNAMAAFRLAKIYAQGQGVPQDYVAAYTWMKIGALHAGDRFQPKPFSEALDQFAAKLSSQQVDDAQRAASAWKPNTNIEK